MHSAGALCTISVMSSLPFLPLVVKTPTSPGALRAPGSTRGWGTGGKGISLCWDSGEVAPVPTSPPDRDAPACPRSYLRGDGVLQGGFACIGNFSSIMLVPTLLHTHRRAMRNTKGNVSSSLIHSFQLALQLVPWKKKKKIKILSFASTSLCERRSRLVSRAQWEARAS